MKNLKLNLVKEEIKRCSYNCIDTLVEIHISKNVKRIKRIDLEYVDIDCVKVIYDGTKEEWEKIVKGDIFTVSVRDYYGYEHFNTPLYEYYDRYFNWLGTYTDTNVTLDSYCEYKCDRGIFCLVETSDGTVEDNYNINKKLYENIIEGEK